MNRGNRGKVLAHLAITERHVAAADRHVASQKTLIEELRRDGHDTKKAEELLTIFEDSRTLQVSDRDRLPDSPWPAPGKAPHEDNTRAAP